MIFYCHQYNPSTNNAGLTVGRRSENDEEAAGTDGPDEAKPDRRLLEPLLREEYREDNGTGTNGVRLNFLTFDWSANILKHIRSLYVQRAFLWRSKIRVCQEAHPVTRARTPMVSTLQKPLSSRCRGGSRPRGSLLSTRHYRREGAVRVRS